MNTSCVECRVIILKPVHVFVRIEERIFKFRREFDQVFYVKYITTKLNFNVLTLNKHMWPSTFWIFEPEVSNVTRIPIKILKKKFC